MMEVQAIGQLSIYAIIQHRLQTIPKATACLRMGNFNISMRWQEPYRSANSLNGTTPLKSKVPLKMGLFVCNLA